MEQLNLHATRGFTENQTKSRGQITLIIGPMFSSKSTTLLTYEKKFKACKKSYILINHSFDNRYDVECKISTHDGIKGQGETLTAKCLSDIDENNKDVLRTTDCFIIDEAQFFTDLVEFCKKWTNYGKIMIIAGLSGDYKQESFAPISNIMPLADKIIHLTSNCSLCGADAPFTKRLIENNDQIVVGNDIYQPRCRNCL